MAVKDVYVIGDEKRMVVRSFINDLKSANLIVHSLPAEYANLVTLPKESIHVAVCFDDTMPADVMEFLRESVIDKGWYLYLIGKIGGLSMNEKKHSSEIPGVRFPYWPVPAKTLIAEIEKTRKDILVVDDDPMMLRSLYSWLNGSFNIHAANSGSAALEFLHQNDVDLVLLDYEMPIMNGKQVLQEIRTSYDKKNLPVIFLTAKNDKETIKSIVGLHPNGYILKSNPAAEIKRSVTSFFSSQISVASN
jgi:CheY-like chemotaxis protein